MIVKIAHIGIAVNNVEDAIKLNHPLMQRVRFKRKDTGEHFRV